MPDIILGAPGPLSVATTSEHWSEPVKVAIDGISGGNTAVIYAYKRSAAAPAQPSANSTYTFSTSTLVGLNNGWTQAIPAGTDPLYVIAASAFSTSASDIIAFTEWSTAQLLSSNGADGADGAGGINAATVFLYKRTATVTAPAVPSTDVEYTFSTGVTTGVNNSWERSLPNSGGPFRWLTTATAISTATFDTIVTSEWAAPAIISQDGGEPITVYLTNESTLLSADADGNVSSFAPAAGNMKVYLGTTDISLSGSPSVVYSIVSNTNVTISIDANGAYTISAMSADLGSAVIRVAYNGVAAYDKTYTISKVKTGASTPVLVLDRESATVTADSTGYVSSYAFAITDVLVRYGTANDTANWTISISAGPGVTANLTALTASITDMTSDTGYINIIATGTGPRTGLPNLQKSLVVTKVRGSATSAGIATGQYWYAEDYGTSPVSGRIYFYSDGRVGSHTGIVGNWFVPTTIDIGDSYWIKMVERPGSEVLSFGDLDTVISLATSPHWHYSVGLGVTDLKAGTFDFTIYSDAAGTVPVTTGVVQLGAEGYAGAIP